ncbi:MAG: hypothetical protein GDA52_01825 [Rhodobacteraceae bacterium]|nr:hypothetical protein [Paracoccaceae bacterium]
MNTQQADYRTDIARLAEDMAKRDADNRTSIADYRTGWEAIRANMVEHQRDYRTSIADLKADAAKRDADAAKRDAEQAKRDKDNQRFLVTLFGLLVAIIIGGFVVSNIFL